MSSIKIGLDLHGVIDSDPKLFSELTKRLGHCGHEIHILTGRELCEGLTAELSDLDIIYDQLFSVTSYHKAAGTVIRYKDGDKSQPLIAPPKWDQTKAIYARTADLDFHIDDSVIYGKYFTDKTQYILFTPAAKLFIKSLLGV